MGTFQNSYSHRTISDEITCNTISSRFTINIFNIIAGFSIGFDIMMY